MEPASGSFISAFEGPKVEQKLQKRQPRRLDAWSKPQHNDSLVHYAHMNEELNKIFQLILPVCWQRLNLATTQPPPPCALHSFRGNQFAVWNRTPDSSSCYCAFECGRLPPLAFMTDRFRDKHFSERDGMRWCKQPGCSSKYQLSTGISIRCQLSSLL